MNKILESTFQFGAALLQALTESHAREHSKGYGLGFKEGYQKGWADATAAITSAAQKAMGTTSSGSETLVEAISLPSGTLREKIVTLAKAKPGLRPMELVRALREIEPDANENSILVTIKRLRSDGTFEERDDSLLYLTRREAA